MGLQHLWMFVWACNTCGYLYGLATLVALVYFRLAQLLCTSLSESEIKGSIPEPVKSKTVLQIACHCFDVFLKLCCPGAKLQR